MHDDASQRDPLAPLFGAAPSSQREPCVVQHINHHLGASLFGVFQTQKDGSDSPFPLIIPLCLIQVEQAMRQVPIRCPSSGSTPLGLSSLPATRRVFSGFFYAPCLLGVGEAGRRAKKASGGLPVASA
jgi:hypothetical protein